MRFVEVSERDAVFERHRSLVFIVGLAWVCLRVVVQLVLLHAHVVLSRRRVSRAAGPTVRVALARHHRTLARQRLPGLVVEPGREGACGRKLSFAPTRHGVPGYPPFFVPRANLELLRKNTLWNPGIPILSPRAMHGPDALSRVRRVAAVRLSHEVVLQRATDDADRSLDGGLGAT